MSLIKRPVLSEKSLLLAELGRYVFIVDRASRKEEIKKDVEKVFKVKVANVNTVLTKGKAKSFRRVKGSRSDYKKAIVTLKSGKIDLFEGAGK